MSDFTSEDRDKAIQRMHAASCLPPCKQWRGTAYYDVPASALRSLVDDGTMGSRKISGHAPTEWRKA